MVSPQEIETEKVREKLFYSEGEVRRLRAALAQAQAAQAADRQRIAVLEAALRPFAEVPLSPDANKLLVKCVVRGPFHLYEADLRRARAALPSAGAGDGWCPACGETEPTAWYCLHRIAGSAKRGEPCEYSKEGDERTRQMLEAGSQPPADAPPDGDEGAQR